MIGSPLTPNLSSAKPACTRRLGWLCQEVRKDYVVTIMRALLRVLSTLKSHSTCDLGTYLSSIVCAKSGGIMPDRLHVSS